ncbi:MAG: hypothetical protein ACXW5U_17665 [Thermoanaerobaculia bacterium]
MAQNESKVIGVFAYRSRAEVVCTDRDACVIAGSEEAMRRHFDEVGVKYQDAITIRKTRFGEIVEGLLAGGAYGFDQESYSRFAPLSRDLGIPVADAAFGDDATGERRFFTVRLAPGGD